MIDLSLKELVLLYLLVALGVATLSWLRAAHRRRSARRQEARSQVWCRACGNRFSDTSATELARCPHCGRPAERGGLPMI